MQQTKLGAVMSLEQPGLLSLLFCVSLVVSGVENGAGQGACTCVETDNSHCGHQRML
jgi:hypothetical protein